MGKLIDKGSGVKMSEFISKRLKVSPKRQITIPSVFYKKLNFDNSEKNEVECFLREDKNEIVIRPVQSETDFSVEILNDLVQKGYSGQDLIKEFEKLKSGVKPAVERMINEAETRAEKLKGSGDEEVEEIFGDLEN